MLSVTLFCRYPVNLNTHWEHRLLSWDLIVLQETRSQPMSSTALMADSRSCTAL